MQVLSIVAGIFGTIVGVVTMSGLGLISVFSPDYSDELLARLKEWSERDY
tara:strand:- start:1249 stop:1398 length:150 start_codon:yes stop_codon:yes gene_type:complete